MNIKTECKRFVSLLVTICMLISSFYTVMAVEYPNAKLIFSGFTMQYGKNGELQGFVDINIENIDATGVSFDLVFDKKYIVPSNHETNNTALTVFESFKQNKDIFPIETIADEEKNYLSIINDEMTNSSIKDETMTVSIVPDRESPNSEYIGETEISWPFEKMVKVIKADNRNLSLGKLSFKIVDPMAVSEMDPSEVEDIISLDSELAAIIYVDDNDREQFVSTIESEWKVDRVLLSVDPTIEKRTVSAYTIYKDGDETDLIAYLNQYMNTVIQKYSDGEQLLDKIKWDPDSGDNFTITDFDDQPCTYDRKGGKYKISQDYTDGFTVTVMVTVTPVYLNGFNYNNKVITYPDDNRPSQWSDLQMPEVITAVLSESFDMYVDPTEQPLQEDWTPDDVTDALKDDPAPVKQVYEHTVDSSKIGEPWMTIADDFNWNIEVKRNVTATAQILDDIVATVDRDGIMTITVQSIDGGGIVADTGFNIYFPNGMVVSSEEDFVTVTINNDGTAEIVVNALAEGITSDFTQEQREILQSLINLGSSDFELSAIPPGSAEGTPSQFTVSQRDNYYKPEIEGDPYIVKDYSKGKKTMFPVYQGQQLSNISTYIMFPDDSTIPVAYHGQTGMQPSELDVAKVVSWEIEGDPTATALPNTVGETVTLVGLLEEYIYTDFGRVKNPDSIYLKIKVTTGEKTITDTDVEDIKITTLVNAVVDVELDSSTTFNFDKKTVGYLPSDVQEQVFTIENIGDLDINGLSVRITDNGGNDNVTDFVISQPLPVDKLVVGDKTTFAIRTKRGLSEGEYTAKVVVSSNNSTELESFIIKFIVTDKDVYKVGVFSDDSTIGYGYLYLDGTKEILSNTYEEFETVNLHAVIVDTGYNFAKWTSSESITFVDEESKDTSFTMIAQDVWVEATFVDSPLVWIRLTDLVDRNEDDSINTLRDMNPPYAAKAFDEKDMSYYVIVDGAVEKNYVEFTLKDTAIKDDITVTVTCNGTDVPTTKTALEYKSDLFGINEGLNTVTIVTSYTDDEGTEYTQTYTLTIYRKKAVDVKMQYGNSPTGLIGSATNIADAAKTAAMADFKINHTYDKNNVPSGAATTYQTMYYTDPWVDGNCDENPYSLFIKNDRAFVDSGFTDLKDSDGNVVDVTTVKRTIIIDTMKTTGDVLYDLQNDITRETIEIPSGGETCVIDLTGYRIRPDVYKIKYTFTDVDGKDRSFTRPLVVTGTAGDVNLDGAVTTDDGDMLYNRLENGFYEQILQSSESWAKVYSYRICEVTEDRIVNLIDANAITNTTPIDYYEVLPSAIGDTMPVFDSSTATWKTLQPAPTDKAILTLDYLGKASYPENEALDPGITENDNIVWVGIGIKHPERLSNFENIQSMDLSFDYDPEILQPCDAAANLYTDTTNYDLDSVLEFNVTNNATSNDIHLWLDADLDKDSIIYNADLDTADKYKTQHITIIADNPVRNVYDANDIPVTAPGDPEESLTVYMIRVPFKLIKYPDPGYVGNVITINLSEQMFAMGSNEDGIDPAASWEGAVGKTIPANNLEEYFTVEISDIFGTNGTYDVKGSVSGWNVNQPVKVEFYKSDASIGDKPFYTFLSSDVDAKNAFKYGELVKTTAKGECKWEFTLPVSDLFEYKMVIKKMSHITYPEIDIKKADIDKTDMSLTLTEEIKLICGDINDDGVIKHTDRWELVRFLNRQRPWDIAETVRFEQTDLNGDNFVNLFDLNLLKKNYEKQYSVPQSTATPNSGEGEGGG